jgi:hypothetical protein
VVELLSALDTDIGYTILIVGMTQVIQFSLFRWERKRTLIALFHGPTRTNSYDPVRNPTLPRPMSLEINNLRSYDQSLVRALCTNAL